MTRDADDSRTVRYGGPRLLRAEPFTDHHSQARQFYLSQTDIEQSHVPADFIARCRQLRFWDRQRAMVS